MCSCTLGIFLSIFASDVYNSLSDCICRSVKINQHKIVWKPLQRKSPVNIVNIFYPIVRQFLRKEQTNSSNFSSLILIGFKLSFLRNMYPEIIMNAKRNVFTFPIVKLLCGICIKIRWLVYGIIMHGCW